MKRKVDKLDIGKLETTPVDSSKLSNVVKNDDRNKYITTQEFNKLTSKKFALTLTQAFEENLKALNKKKLWKIN